MKRFLPIYFASILLSMLISCRDKYVNHKLEYSQLGPCNTDPAQIQMESNIMGERYQFVACLPADFDGKTYEVRQSGDSLRIEFQSKEGPTSSFQITLDIDAQPRYHHIWIGGQWLSVGEVAN